MGRRVAIFAATVACAATLGAGLPGAAAGWAIQPTPNVANVADNDLKSVSCPTATTCFAVGSGTDASTGASVPLAEKWDGIRWTIQATPEPPRALLAFLLGMACRATGGCTAAGSYFSKANGDEFTLIERLRSGRWGVQPTQDPPGATMNFLQAVSCVAPDGCTVAGTAEMPSAAKSTTLVFHRDHGQWVIQPTPSPAAGNPSLTGLSCGPADGCTAVGNTILPGDAGTLTTLAEHR